MAGVGTSEGADTVQKQLEVQLASLNAIAKAQGRYLHALLTSIAILWGWQALKPAETKFVILGLELPTTFLWTIAPAVLTVITLALVGSLNVIGPHYERITETCKALGINFWFSDMDSNKNIIDYLSWLRLRWEVPVQPTVEKRRSFGNFLYPGVIGASIATALAANYPGSSIGFRALRICRSRVTDCRRCSSLVSGYLQVFQSEKSSNAVLIAKPSPRFTSPLAAALRVEAARSLLRG